MKIVLDIAPTHVLFASTINFYFMKQNFKKIRELSIATPLLKSLNISPLSVYSDAESPDLIIAYNNKLIGVEITKCFPDQVLYKFKHSEAELNVWINEFCLSYTDFLLSIGVSNSIFHISFNSMMEIIPNISYKQKFIKEVKDEINSLIRFSNMNMINDNATLYTKDYFNQREYKFINGVSWNGNNKYKTFVTPIFTEWVKTIPYEAIEFTLKQKEKLLLKYKKLYRNKNIDEYWLLIDLFDQMQYGFDEQDIISAKSDYDRVFLMNGNRFLQIR